MLIALPQVRRCKVTVERMQIVIKNTLLLISFDGLFGIFQILLERSRMGKEPEELTSFKTVGLDIHMLDLNRVEALYSF